MGFMPIRRWLVFGLLCVAVFLSLGNGALGAMDQNNLRRIIDYIRGYGLGRNYHYAVAVRLDRQYCRDPNPRNLAIALPEEQMRQMKNAISQEGGMYNPSRIGDIVAARPRKRKSSTDHAEWRLLYGGQNSPVERILANKDQNSCLIFFSRFSPCVNHCLNLLDEKSIVMTIYPLFNRYNEDSRAFVFEAVYYKDAEKDAAMVVEAWSLIQNAPLFRCNNNGCILCFDNNRPGNHNPCLDPQQGTSSLIG